MVVDPLELCRLDLGRLNVGRLALRYRVLLLPRLGMGCFSALVAVSPRAVSPWPVSFSCSHGCDRPPLGHEHDRRGVDGSATRGLRARGPQRPGLGVTPEMKLLTQIGEVTEPGRKNFYRRPDGSLTHW